MEAISACGRCGTFTCVACQQVATDERSYCVRCLSVQPPLAARSSRFVANLIDSVLFTFLWMLPVFLGIGLMASMAKEDGLAIAGVMLLLMGVGFVAAGGLQLYLQVTYGQSAGKKLMGIKVVDLEGRPVSLVSLILLRNVVPILIGTVVSPFGIVDALFIFGDQQRCLHDLIASTRVVQVRPS